MENIPHFHDITIPQLGIWAFHYKINFNIYTLIVSNITFL